MITNEDDYVKAITSYTAPIQFGMNSITHINYGHFLMNDYANSFGTPRVSAPRASGGAIRNSGEQGFPNLEDHYIWTNGLPLGSTERLYFGGGHAYSEVASATQPIVLTFYDVIWECDDFANNASGAQAVTNFPSASTLAAFRPDYCSGGDWITSGLNHEVELWVMKPTADSTTLSVQYNSGKTANLGSVTGTASTINWHRIPLDSTAPYVNSIESLTLGTAGATVANIKLALLKPLGRIVLNSNLATRIGSTGGLANGFRMIDRNAAIMPMVRFANLTTTGVITANLRLLRA